MTSYKFYYSTLGPYGWDLIFVPLLLVSFSTDLDLLHIDRLKIRTGPCKLILELTCKWIFTHAKAESSVLNKHFCLHIIFSVTAIRMDLVKPETTFTDWVAYSIICNLIKHLLHWWIYWKENSYSIEKVSAFIGILYCSQITANWWSSSLGQIADWIGDN